MFLAKGLGGFRTEFFARAPKLYTILREGAHGKNKQKVDQHGENHRFSTLKSYDPPMLFTKRYNDIRHSFFCLWLCLNASAPKITLPGDRAGRAARAPQIPFFWLLRQPKRSRRRQRSFRRQVRSAWAFPKGSAQAPSRAIRREYRRPFRTFQGR